MRKVLNAGEMALKRSDDVRRSCVFIYGAYRFINIVSALFWDVAWTLGDDGLLSTFRDNRMDLMFKDQAV